MLRLIAVLSVLTLFAVPMLADEAPETVNPDEAALIASINQQADDALTTPENDKVISLRHTAGCGSAGDSCTSDSDCCSPLGCTDGSNSNPNTCQHIAFADSDGGGTF